MDDYLLPPVRRWNDWRLLYTDVERWRPVLERVRAGWRGDAQLRPLMGLGMAGFPGTCAVFLLGKAAVIKFFPPMLAGVDELAEWLFPDWYP